MIACAIRCRRWNSPAALNNAVVVPKLLFEVGNCQSGRMLTAVVVLLSSFSSISTIGSGRQHLRPPVIGRTVTVELQRHSPVAKEEAPAKDVSPVVATAKADIKKIKHYKRLWERAGLCRGISVRPERSFFPIIRRAAASRRPGLSRNWTPCFVVHDSQGAAARLSLFQDEPGQLLHADQAFVNRCRE